ncbi:hypothetical protein CFC21_020996 [Triticum aestivum]|uniref:Disease resistance protein At4g27190-like leucine-rich repeats domain-containing protein n=2 Tax=Triticum aestivum TaxID=4565 RepID=A0A9R1E8R4_WHEAT|nr:uncharacterized protein LOC123040120 [Triticum aestivum]KAF7005898.1 hypothetical protein CFC21_020996 [Triticum aestivum]
MSREPRSHHLRAKDLDDAVKQLLGLLCECDRTTQGKAKAFCFGGWDAEGLGASAVLRATAKALRSTSDPDMKRHIGRIIHVDCSLWKNRRAMQRAIAEDLNLQHVMALFDEQDEEDDFRGVDESSREVIASIGRVIYESLMYEKFLLILHYGGDEDIDLAECGIPEVGPFGKGKLLWTNHGRFPYSVSGLHKLMSISTYIDMTIYSGPQDMVSNSISIKNSSHPVCAFFHKQAAAVIDHTGMDGINPTTVLDCLLYSTFLTKQSQQNPAIGVDYGWDTHACNYWICDGILQGDRAWEIGNALYGVISRLGYSSAAKGPFARYLNQRENPYNGWYSVTSNKKTAHDMCYVPNSASSYFLTYKGHDPIYLRYDFFHLATNLRVLKLSKCSFDFAYPPFRCCHNLRFLWLDHCTNTRKEYGSGSIFPNLLVFDLHFTEYVLFPQMIELMTNLREINTKGVSWKTIGHAWKRLQKLHKLRVTESSDVITVDSFSSIDMMDLQLLDLSGNTRMESLPELSSAISLKMLVLDGCSSLEHIVLQGALPLLESFSFDGFGPADNWTLFIDLPQRELRLKSPVDLDEKKAKVVPQERNKGKEKAKVASQKEEETAKVALQKKELKAKVTKISLEGCVRLHKIFLRALPNLKELDLSSTSIKVLNLKAMGVPGLRKLFLLGCQQLRALIWDGYPRLQVLHVDTRGTTRSMLDGSFDFKACIAFTDGRFIGPAIQGIKSQIYPNSSRVHLLITCMDHSQASITNSIEEVCPSQETNLVPTGKLSLYNDIALVKDVKCLSLLWDRRQLQPLEKHIEIGEGSYNFESIDDNGYFRDFVLTFVQSLHVHDNSSITAIPPKRGGIWRGLEWCHVERCPKLHILFKCWRAQMNFEHIRAFSASDLPMAYCIWGRGINTQSSSRCFKQLQHIYLHNCPQLVFVLPISFILHSLETLQIAYCSNLRHVFPLDKWCPQEIASGVKFDNLKHIKLYHLHSLEQVCEAKLTAPALQTISLRDCWGLRRLPAVAHQDPKPVVDCEKDWWDKLVWDGVDVGHDPSLFEIRHSAHYKKTIPRGSLLR